MGARILVVDDEHNIRIMLRLALQHDGYLVETAADGAEGLDKFGDGSEWDLVLLDHRMPGMEGTAVLREILLRHPGMKVIMITAFGTIDLAVEAMRAGAMNFLRKPFTADTLRGAVRSALSEAAEKGIQENFSPVTFSMTTINGFRIETLPKPGEYKNGNIKYSFRVTDPLGEQRICDVVLPPYLVELVKAHADREHLPGGDRFWQALCEESLANYVWQESGMPLDDILHTEDLTAGMRRWIDSVLAA